MEQATYYGDGVEITSKQARDAIFQFAEMKGYDPVEVRELWNSRFRSEEARDILFDISSCTIEIVA